MKQKTVKKTPADYPQMIFRVSQAAKDRLHELIEKATVLVNKTRMEGSKKVRKNDVIVDALFFGLLSFEKSLQDFEKSVPTKTTKKS